jgi:hypothetical protein
LERDTLAHLCFDIKKDSHQLIDKDFDNPHTALDNGGVHKGSNDADQLAHGHSPTTRVRHGIQFHCTPSLDDRDLIMISSIALTRGRLSENEL